MTLENIVGKKSIENRKKYEQKYGLMSAISGYARNALLRIGFALLPALYGGCSGDETPEPDAAPERRDSGVPLDPCEELDCGENSLCNIVDEEAVCLCDKERGYRFGENGCEPMPSPCTACTGEYLSRCVTAQTLETCIPESQAQCMDERLSGGFCQPLLARCPAEYSECRDGRCVTFPDKGNLDVCRSGTRTNYCFIADTFDIVEEEGTEERRDLVFGPEINGTINEPPSCAGNQGVFLGEGPLRSYSRVCFNMDWCGTPDQTVQYIVRGNLAFQPGLLEDESLRDEKGQYIGPSALIQFGKASERFQIYPSVDPCETREFARPLYLEGSSTRICIEGPADSHALVTKIEIVECTCGNSR